MLFLLLALLPALAVGIADFATCDADPSLGCFAASEATDCTAPAKCSTTDPAITPPTAGAMGCCVGGATTTTTTVATTVASVTTTASTGTCVDKLNPMTGVSDCPARAFLCTNSVYLQVMRDQCPKTCNFCSSTGAGTGTGTGTSTSCVDLVNPTTRVSDCPSMRAYCTNTVYMPLMRVQCPATCGFCTSG